MSGFSGAVRRWVARDKGRARKPRSEAIGRADAGTAAAVPAVDIAPDDPIVAFFQGASGPVDVETLTLASPAKQEFLEAGVKLVVPLIAQGELIGLLNLGPRLSEQEYSADDRKLLGNLAAQAAPAVRVGQLVRQQEAEVRSRERIDQELRVAQLIQQQFLPRELPELGGWQVAAHYRPAREVGGDFYDFIELPDGRVGIVVGDVTDKGVPAALVMATTRSILRSDAPRLLSPGRVLERANDLLVPDIPAQMFVTCLYGVLDPASGRLQYANAGHNVPYVATEGGVVELRARGMPLGLMQGMEYEEKEAQLGAGETILLHSDGLAEAHDRQGEMFGFPRLMKIMEGISGDRVIDALLSELARFTGPSWEQEDDITLVTLERARAAGAAFAGADEGAARRTLAEFTIASDPGNERVVMERVVDAVGELSLSERRLEQLQTAVSEAAMNAIEHGNRNDPELEVKVRVSATEDELHIEITDQGGERPIPEPEEPDIEAKLAGLQKARGWGLFLIQNMVDDMRTTSDEHHHTIELIVHLKGAADGNQ